MSVRSYIQIKNSSAFPLGFSSETISDSFHQEDENLLKIATIIPKAGKNDHSVTNFFGI